MFTHLPVRIVGEADRAGTSEAADIPLDVHSTAPASCRYARISPSEDIRNLDQAAALALPGTSGFDLPAKQS